VIHGKSPGRLRHADIRRQHEDPLMGFHVDRACSRMQCVGIHVLTVRVVLYG
jgi:hypothetical protein